MKATRRMIENLVKCVNEETNSSYVLEYNNLYGYQMYLLGENGVCHNGLFGFTVERRSANAMKDYLFGLLAAIRYYNNLKK